LRNVVDELESKTQKSSKLEACPTGNYEKYFRLVNENFIYIDRVAHENGLNTVDGVLLDLGISSYHYRFNKGFSFQHTESPLDMRLSDKQKVTAADLLNALPLQSLTDLFCVTMSFSEGKRLAKGVTEFRKVKKILTTGDLIETIHATFPDLAFLPKRKSISFPTLPFLALRIAVNTELDNLSIALGKAWGLLKDKGRLVVISFHSGEDKIVKNYFKDLEMAGFGKIVMKLIKPSESEIENNLRARSAKMRVIEKSMG
jgi:16S rRNA (cytosine1402-N4)-methyltransferase